MKFELSDEQTNSFLEWRRIQTTKGRCPDAKPRYTFCFSLGNIGTKVKVIDTITKEELNLSEDMDVYMACGRP